MDQPTRMALHQHRMREPHIPPSSQGSRHPITGTRTLVGLPQNPRPRAPSQLPVPVTSNSFHVTYEPTNKTTRSKLQQPEVRDSQSQSPVPRLRRKDPLIKEYTERARTPFSDTEESRHTVSPAAEKALSPYNWQNEEYYGESMFRNPFPEPPTMSGVVAGNHSQRSTRQKSPIPELSTLATNIPTHFPTSETPVPLSTGTPSTFYTESVGPWSSRNTTPISMSSYSPGFSATSGPKLSSPFRGKVAPSSSTDSYQHARPSTQRRGTTESDVSDVYKSPSNQSAISIPTPPSKLRKKSKKDQSPSKRISPPPRKSSMKFQSPSGKSTKGNATGSPEPRLPELPSASLQHHTEIVAEASDAEMVHGIPPRRPSRQGTSTLDVEASPVVQSELPPDALKNHRRRRSTMNEGQKYAGHMAPTVSSANRAQPVAASRSSSRRPSPALERPQSKQTSRDPSTLRSAPTPTSTASRVRRDSNESTASRSGKLSSRFNLFGRSKKSREEPDEAGASQRSRPARKGPAAGTGHEGYGKYAQRGRRPSLGGSAASRGRSTSTVDSTGRSASSWKSSNPGASDSELDEFVTQRLDPIIINGGGGASRDDLRTQEDNEQQGSSLNRIQTKPAGPRGRKNHLDRTILPKTAFRTSPEQLSQSTDNSRPPSLAVRRSMRRLRESGGSLEDIRVPTPIKTSSYDTTQSLTTLDSVNSPIPRSDSTLPPSSSVTEDTSKKSKAFKWNIFSRSRRTQKSRSPSPERRRLRKDVPVTVAKVPDSRPIPYYALMDSEQEEELSRNTSNLEEIMQALDASPPEEPEYLQPANPESGLGLRSAHGQSILLPSPPNFNSLFAWDSVSQQSPRQQTDLLVDPLSLSADAPEKQTRLSPVGRIPKIVSSRDRERRPSDQSFSRPFASSKLHRDDHLQASPNLEQERPILVQKTDPMPIRLFNSPDSAQPTSTMGRPLRAPLSTSEFLTYPSWYGSVSSTSSNSNAPVQPSNSKPRGPVSTGPRIAEEEVWNEYDDLIDHVLSPPQSQSLGPPQQGYFHPSAANFLAPDDHLKPPRDSATTFCSSTGLTSANSMESMRLRRSRIVSALHSSLESSTPSTLAELVAQYEERNRNSTILLNRMSYLFEEAEEVEAEKEAAHTPKPEKSANMTSNRARTTILLDIAERYREGPVGLSNLRYGALMISRWLSFSRVLFSPVHNKITAERGERVLVLDGLGNDDWSYYCAETYSTAEIYSLNSMIQATTASRETSADAWPAPPNHKAIKINNSAHTFPFPQSYFAAVVFRFPAAMPESTLKRTMGECYRVLRPGGYLEMAVMDLDMVNMGSRTRRAVRMLKVRMNVADPGISLKPASDNTLKILGRRGFQNLNKCIVSVPVAGIVTSSSVDSSSSRHSQGSTSRQESASAAGSKAASFTDPDIRGSTSSGSDRNFLLSDLIADDSPKSDQRITKMVAKVGRWWYTRCYEWAVLPDGDLERSIWADKKVLEECESRGSGFKLLIAYAQKPLDARRRTLSEPSRPTGAIAGGPTPIASLHDSI